MTERGMFSAASQFQDLDWSRLRVFIAVVRSGGLTKATEVLHLTQSAVSRQIFCLEKDMGCQLLIRNPKGLSLTHKGQILFDVASQVYDELHHVQQAVSKGRHEPKGPLTIAAPLWLGCEWLVPNLKKFLVSYQDIAVSVLFQEQEADLSQREADVAIQLMPSTQANMVQELLFSDHLKLYASQNYLKECGTPTKVNHLDYHRLIAYDASGHEPYSKAYNEWLCVGRESSNARKPYVVIDSFLGIKTAAQEGLGIAALFQRPSDSLGPSLINILPEVVGPKMDVYFVYPQILKHSQKIMVFGRYLRALFSQALTPGVPA